MKNNSALKDTVITALESIITALKDSLTRIPPVEVETVFGPMHFRLSDANTRAGNAMVYGYLKHTDATNGYNSEFTIHGIRYKNLTVEIDVRYWNRNSDIPTAIFRFQKADTFNSKTNKFESDYATDSARHKVTEALEPICFETYFSLAGYFEAHKANLTIGGKVSKLQEAITLVKEVI